MLVVHDLVGELQHLLVGIGLALDQELGEVACHLAEVEDRGLVLLSVIALEPHHHGTPVAIVVFGELQASQLAHVDGLGGKDRARIQNRRPRPSRRELSWKFPCSGGLPRKATLALFKTASNMGFRGQ